MLNISSVKSYDLVSLGVLQLCDPLLMVLAVELGVSGSHHAGLPRVREDAHARPHSDWVGD
jgi:hypothetical protein